MHKFAIVVALGTVGAWRLFSNTTAEIGARDNHTWSPATAESLKIGDRQYFVSGPQLVGYGLGRVVFFGGCATLLFVLLKTRGRSDDSY